MSGAARALHCRKQRAFKPFLKRMGNPSKLLRAWDRDLQFSLLNEEFPVSASHQLALITSLPFVHTARRYYRLNGLVSLLDRAQLRCTRGSGDGVAGRSTNLTI